MLLLFFQYPLNLATMDVLVIDQSADVAEDRVGLAVDATFARPVVQRERPQRIQERLAAQREDLKTLGKAALGVGIACLDPLARVNFSEAGCVESQHRVDAVHPDFFAGAQVVQNL